MQVDEQRSDTALWAQLAAGDDDALTALYERHRRAVYNHCFRLTASWASAEDLTAQTFIQLWHKRTTVTLRESSARPWLLTVATNLARNEQRGRLRHDRLLRRVARSHQHEPDPANDVAARVDAERQMAALLDTIRVLPRAEREGLALCVWAEVSYADAAAQLGISESSVRARVSRARKRLTALTEESR